MTKENKNYEKMLLFFQWGLFRGVEKKDQITESR